jgi:hypothetical protein
MMLLPEPGVTTGGFCGCREGPAPAFEVTSALLIGVVLVNRLATVASIDRVGKGRPAVDRETAEDHEGLSQSEIIEAHINSNSREEYPALNIK